APFQVADDPVQIVDLEVGDRVVRLRGAAPEDRDLAAIAGFEPHRWAAFEQHAQAQRLRVEVTGALEVDDGDRGHRSRGGQGHGVLTLDYRRLPSRRNRKRNRLMKSRYR